MSKIYLCVNFHAGRAGSGWPNDKPRHIRVPFVELENALRAFDAAIIGKYHAVQSGGLEGVIPDSAWVEHDISVFGTKVPVSFRRESDGASVTWSNS